MVTTAGSISDKKLRSGNNYIRKINRYPYIFIAPFFIVFICFNLFPTVFSLFLSFTRWGGYGEMEFVGFHNYTYLLKDSLFYKTIYNTALLMLASIPFMLAASIILAYILNNVLPRVRNFYQVVYFLPYITTPIALGILFALIFGRNTGTLNMILLQLGIIDEALFWLGMPNLARIVVVILLIWKSFGYIMVLVMAGLQTIDTQLYEAAVIDGANSRQSFIRITIPLLKPVLIFCVITSLIGGFQIFAEPFMLFSGGSAILGGPDRCAFTISMYLFESAFRSNQWGYASALGYALFMIVAVFSIGSLKVMSKGGMSHNE